MNTYKITNITNTVGKRDFKYNSDLNIEYVDNMVKKSIKIRPNNSIYLTVSSLPLSVQKLRVKGLVTVSEIGATELAKTMNDAKQKVLKKVETVEEIEEKKISQSKKVIITGKKRKEE
jgi:hypothetical protein